MALLHLTSKDFKETIASGLTLVDFWAPWCGPCRMLGPIIEELANEVDYKVAKVDVDEEDSIAAAFGITSIPTLILFKDGKEVARTMGYQPKANLVSFVNQYK